MSHEYRRLPDPGAGLRLHLNENTAGCSARVLAALRALDATDVSTYPDYAEGVERTASYFDVSDDRLLLTNGMDEGILATCVAYLGRDAATAVPEAIVPQPAFEEYASSTEACGGAIVNVAPGANLTLGLDAVLERITGATRLVFLTSPGNPSGLLVPREAVVAIAARLPERALVFLDEAYADFTDYSFLPDLPAHPNVVIGRTFSKAHGLAALRIGALIGAPAVIARIRPVVPPYSLNVFAVAGLLAALADGGHVRWYREQVAASRELVYQTCRRLGLPCWPSEANFVLIRVGDRAGEVAAELAKRRIFVRDRSHQPGCAGCLRVTAGVVAHTEVCLAALEDVLCGAV